MLKSFKTWPHSDKLKYYSNLLQYFNPRKSRVKIIAINCHCKLLRYFITLAPDITNVLFYWSHRELFYCVYRVMKKFDPPEKIFNIIPFLCHLGEYLLNGCVCGGNV